MIGFIGLGNMADAMIGGILKAKCASPAQVIGSAKTASTCERMTKKHGIVTYTDNCEVAKAADILFLAVKPVFLETVLEQIKNDLKPDVLIVSIAAGKSISFYKEHLAGVSCKVIRCMPNTPALVLEGCTAVCAEEAVTAEELSRVMELLQSFGEAREIPERLMDAFVGVSGSSPAYVFMFIEAMADAAVLAGIPRNDAYVFAAQAVYGSAKMVLETGMHPAQLKDMVCSPGGTTIEAVKVLEREGMRSAVMDAIAACVEKSKSL